MKRLLAGALASVMFSAAAQAQSTDLGSLIPHGSESATGRIVLYGVVLTVLSIAPGLVVMLTSFTRFVIALSFLRLGLGLQSTPANLVLISLALFMTAFVMAPTFDRAWRQGVSPLMEQKISQEEAIASIAQPFREFMLAQVREKDVALFESLSKGKFDSGPREAVDLRVLVPAFMISELRRGFEIGFLVALPFLVIDLIVSTIIMSMGMMMLPPSVISLPVKVMFFVLIDGWNLLVGSLVRSVN